MIVCKYFKVDNKKDTFLIIITINKESYIILRSF